jgi:hypothetical protein
MSAFLKSQDPNHLITIGEEGFYSDGGSNGDNPQPNSSEGLARAGQMDSCGHVTCFPAINAGAGAGMPGVERRRADRLMGGSLWTVCAAGHKHFQGLITGVAAPPSCVADWAPATGQDFIANHNIDSIDYAAFHMWPGALGGNSGGLHYLCGSGWG